jgi:rod shape-determining protein MreC
MDSLLNRYRNITVLLLVVAGQLILLAVQVKDDRDIPFIRVWTITAVTPFARFVEAVRGGGAGVFRDYIHLHDADAENRRLRDEIGKLKMDNIFLRNELSQADRVKALQMFQAETQSKTLAARVFGAGAAASSKMVYVDRGSVAGVQRGMAVVTPDGIVGKVIAAYPTASQVLLVTDSEFAAGVISQKNQTRGDLKGTGKDYCVVDYVPPADKVEVGEWFYTSGDDRIFPRGFPAGVVKEVRDGTPFKEILVEPSGVRRGLEDVLIVLNGVHQEIPKTPPSNQPMYIAPPPPSSASSPVSAPSGATGATAATGTEADRLRARYKSIGDAQNHIFGEGLPGSKPPNFNLPATGAAANTGAPASTPHAPPSATGVKGAPGGTGVLGAPAAPSGATATGVRGNAAPSGSRGAFSATEESDSVPEEPSGRMPGSPVTGVRGGPTSPTGAKGASGSTRPKGATPATGVSGPTGGPPR